MSCDFRFSRKMALKNANHYVFIFVKFYYTNEILSSSSKIWPDEYFLSTGTRKGTKMFNGPANLRKFHRRKRDKSCSKDPYFLCYKTLRYGMELRQDLYLNMRKLGNLSLGVFFSVDLFFRRRRPINKT